MSGKGNSFRKNIQNDTETKSSVRKKRERKPSGNAKSARDIGSKLVKIAGLFLLILSVYFLIAFISYLFTWQEDQSYVSAANGGWNTLFKSREELALAGIEHPILQNWMGIFGALLAHQFIYKWFGVASFLFISILFIVGYRLLFKIKIISIWKVLGYSLFSLIFISLTLGFIHGFINNYPHFLEGEFGFWSNRLLQAQIGVPGVAGLLIFTVFTILIIVYNLDFKFAARRSKAHDGPLATDIASANSLRDEEHYMQESEYRVDPVEFNLNRMKEAEQREEKLPQRVHAPKPQAVADNTGPDFTVEAQGEKAEAKNELKNPPLTVSAIKEEKPSTADELVEKVGQYDPKLDLSGYQ